MKISSKFCFNFNIKDLKILIFELYKFNPELGRYCINIHKMSF